MSLINRRHDFITKIFRSKDRKIGFLYDPKNVETDKAVFFYSNFLFIKVAHGRLDTRFFIDGKIIKLGLLFVINICKNEDNKECDIL